VLCGGCRNPETNVVIKGDKIFLNCRACGKSTQCDPTNRLVSFMTKRDEKAKPKGAAKKPEPAKGAGKTTKEETEDEDWCLSTTREAVEERRRVTLGLTDTTDTEKTETTVVNLTVAPGQNAVEVLSKFWETNPSHEEAFNKITALAAAQAWSESTLLRSYLFPSLFAVDIKKDFYKKASYLNLFVKANKKQQKVVMFCVEKLCQLIPAVIPALPSFLNGLFEEEVLDEEILIQWYKHPITDANQKTKFNPKVSKAIRDSAKVFIEWLQNADESEDDD